MNHRMARFLALLGLFALALGVRLAVWRWHEFYPLGGDETEYFNQAVALLRDRQYTELRLMRPPLYTAFLAASILLVDSLVQQLRLVQAVVSAATVLPLAGITWQITRSRHATTIAGVLAAFCYTFASVATELLSETLFLAGFATLLWLLLHSRSSSRRVAWAAAAGLTLGALLLVRSVALPLLPLATIWLGWAGWNHVSSPRHWRSWLVLPAVFVCCTLAPVVPWTLRNYVTYGAPILIDTTGAENLWLDNNPTAATPADPLGREAAKQALYALGDDRAARQELATVQGLAAIRDNPGWFAAKAWGEIKKLFALEYFDDLRARQAIWVPPAEVAARLVLGDGIWLVVLLGGAAGLWLFPGPRDGRAYWPDIRWVLVPWVLYTVFTAALFHTELRYRLPLYPALLPFAAWALTRASRTGTGWRWAGAVCTGAACVALTLLHRTYPVEATMLAQKHVALWQAEQSLRAGDGGDAATYAQVALGHDARSVLARVALGRAAMLQGNTAQALMALEEAEAALPDHVQAHLLRGAVLRATGELDAARRELAYEGRSLQNGQAWGWDVFAPFSPPPTDLAVGAGLDLGFVRGFHLPEADAYRWTTGRAEVRLTLPDDTAAVLIELAAARPATLPAPTVAVSLDGAPIGTCPLTGDWETCRLPVSVSGQHTIALDTPTFRPRTADPASPDGRALGVQIRRITAVSE